MSPAECAYDYTDQEGRLLYQVVRRVPKRFTQRRPDGNGGWCYDLEGVPSVPYHWPELLAKPKAPIFVTEGEKDADRLRGVGLVATTNRGGALAFSAEFVEALRGRHVALLEDNDPAGRERSRKLGAALLGVAASVRILALPGLPEKGDVSDWLDQGHDKEDLLAFARSVKPLEPPPAAVTSPGTEDLPALQWPEPLAEAAYHGLAGELVRTLEPHTEADPAALLVHFLAYFGNVVGRSPYFRTDGTDQRANLFVACVGNSSKARKGTANGCVKRLFARVAPDWLQERQVSGLSSGEGLIHAVRDTGDGTEDKRLLVVEQELASALKVMRREGNTLSAILREAWDGSTLHTLTKNNPAKATEAHISVLAHITTEELRRHLDATEQANGFANRFLWTCVKRSKLLPEGGRLEEGRLAPLLERLAETIAYAQQAGELAWSEEAREDWATIYRDLSDGQPGLLGAVTARSEAQVVRLSLIYALLDQTAQVEPVHLEAALALWDYCEASCRFLFGDALGNPDADTILAALRARPEGLSRREILHTVFQRNKSAEAVTHALTLLLQQGRVRCEKAPPGDPGRPEERWFAL